MDRSGRKNQIRRQRYCRQRIAAVCLILCLIMSNLNAGSMIIYATEGSKRTFDIGRDVKAVLKDGVLTVKGYGDTYDYSEDTAPFAADADEIRTLVIEDGVTYIGAYLFYGLGSLRGELILPESIVGFGDYAFSGESQDQAPGFFVIRNEFEGGEITEKRIPVRPASPSQIGETQQNTAQEETGGSQETEDADTDGIETEDKRDDKTDEEIKGQDTQAQPDEDKTTAEETSPAEETEGAGKSEEGTKEEEAKEEGTKEEGTKEEETKEEGTKAEGSKEETKKEKEEKETKEEKIKAEGTESEGARAGSQEDAGKKEYQRAEKTREEEEKKPDVQKTADKHRSSSYPVLAAIEDYSVPLVGVGQSDEKSDTSGGGSDTAGGGSDTAGSGSNTSGSGSDTSGSGADTSGSGSDTSGGGSNTSGSGSDTSGSGSNTSGSGSDTSGSGSDTSGSGADISGGGSNASGSGTDTSEDSSDTSGGSSSTSGSGPETPGDGSGTSGDGSNVPGDGADTPGSGSDTPGDGANTPEDGSDTSGGNAGTPDAGSDGAGSKDDLPDGTEDHPGDAADIPGTEDGNKQESLPESETEYETEHETEATEAAGAAGGGNKGNASHKEPESLEDEELEYDVEYITRQKIENPETLFYGGQTGMVICSADNDTFIEAAGYAGYQLADSCVTVTLDDAVDMELPACEGQICLPECPEEIRGPWEENEFFSYEFAGWTTEPASEPTLEPTLEPTSEPTSEPDGAAAKGVPASRTEALAAGEYMDIGDDSHIYLYSAWHTEGTYQLGVRTNREADTAVYRLVNKDTDEPVESGSGYIFTYQWQYLQGHTKTDLYDSRMQDPSKDEGDWINVEGADGPVYERQVEPDDITRRFRCAVTPVKQARSRSADVPVTLYSEAAAGVAVLQKVYVDPVSGDDGNTGLENDPVKTIEAAAQKLNTASEGGSEDSNQIILLHDYSYTSVDFLKNNPVPVTIKGVNSDIVFTFSMEKTEYEFALYDNIAFDEITLKGSAHIYGNGHNITVGDTVTCKNELYLYGAAKGGDSTKNVGKIEVRSGSYSRIAGYIRSLENYDAEHHKASITVDGKAKVGSIVAGSASGAVLNADVSINIKGGTVSTLMGGCQGFSNVKAPFSGKTEINISGGTVSTIYGAGSGRSTGIPTFQGELNINVTGGSVTNLFGSGSAAYVVKNGEKDTAINISVEGGTVKNIYAAGIGGDGNVTGGNDANGTPVSDFGSLTGNAVITIKNDAVITGSIYASGKGYSAQDYATDNAYLNGRVKIAVDGGTVNGSIYGGGEGISKTGYERSARVSKDSVVTVEINGGTVEGNIYGGGKVAAVEGDSSVTINGGTAKKNVYGGGEEGLTEGKAAIYMKNGTVNGSIYGGALGKTGNRFILGGATVNMTGGWVRGNVYGGSELSDDGKDGTPDTIASEGLMFVNLTGGRVGGTVFGGGFQGTVNGSTHVHVGLMSVGKCNYYKSHPEEKPDLNSSSLYVEGSVYAGGDYGGDSADLNYDTITVNGFSHVYIDGDGYSVGNTGSAAYAMDIKGGVFGSGASCDAGDVRLVTLDHFGTKADATGSAEEVSGAVTSIQRADQVRLIQSHVRLAGQSDVANSNKTALYSLNRIGDKGNSGKLGNLGNSLVLEGGSTLVLDSESINVANLKSVDETETKEVTQEMLPSTPNTVVLATGTVFRISYTPQGGTEEYGAVNGYFYMIAGDTAEAYAFARPKTAVLNPSDGGFMILEADDELEYTNVGTSYRYWKAAGENASAMRHVVLTAQNTGTTGQDEGFAVAEGTIELPPVADADVSTYIITEITRPNSMTLADAAVSKGRDQWVMSGADISVENEKGRIRSTPAATFGLLMYQENGGSDAADYIISNETTVQSGNNSIIGKGWEYDGSDALEMPEIGFNLTYYNDGINVSRDLGTVTIVLERQVNGVPKETVTMNVEIVTKASVLSEQEVDLYATKSGSYTGRMTIPAGSTRSLELSGITIPQGGAVLKTAGSNLSGYEIAVTMKPVQSQGWNTVNLMTDPYDLSAYQTDRTVMLGTTDSRYEAQVEFVLYNNGDFTPKSTDNITLTLKDDSQNEVPVTLNIHWKESIVSGIMTAAGKQYNGLSSADKVEISPQSSFTAAFTLGAREQSVTSSDVWMELQKEDGTKGRLPVGTKLTLLGPDNRFYFYIIPEILENDRIQLSGFTQMWQSGKFTGNIDESTITVIVELDGTQGLDPGDYSLRMRNETGADSKGAEFTVNNSVAGVNLNGQGGMARGIHTIRITVLPQQDTRLTDKAAVVLSPAEDSVFPRGTAFISGEKKYYPVGGKVYMVLESNHDENVIVMDTTHTDGLEPGNNRMNVQLFAAGINSGSGLMGTAELTYGVKANPAYSINVRAAGNERVTAPGSTVRFTAASSIQDAGDGTSDILVEVKRKENGIYTAAADWETAGNTGIPSGESTRDITVTVPQDAPPGTYRIIFSLGDRTTWYNMIIQAE